MNKSGISRRNFDESVRPQNDLYGHVNGRWLREFEIPADRASDGAFRELHDVSEGQVRQIVESQPPDSLIGSLYASFMAEDVLEALGSQPLVPQMKAISQAPDLDSLVRVMGRAYRCGVSGPVSVWVDTDPGSPSRYAIHLGQSGLGLPDEAYYREEQYAPIRQAYQETIGKLFTLVTEGLPDGEGLPYGAISPAEAAEKVMAVETRLAASHWDVVKDRDATATYNPMSFEELVDLAPGFPWEIWTGALEGPVDRPDLWGYFVVMEPSYLEGLATACRELPLDMWKAWASWRVVASRAGLMNAAVVEGSFDFYGRTLQGREEVEDRWKRGVRLVNSALGELVGQEYVAKHFPPGHKAHMQRLVGDLIEAYRQSITKLDWLGEETKQKALQKLDGFTPKIGYPDKWRDYSALKLPQGQLVEAVAAASAHEWDRDLAKLGGLVDRTEWFMTPQTVNAYYNPGMNEIVFPAAILQPPFFDQTAEDAANYGGIGAVIGHEIGHGFDDQGSKYNELGALEDWWTEQDRAAFEERTKALIAQYDAFELDLPDGPKHVNGALTIGENIGDLGGLAIAWRAYQLALARAGLTKGPVIDRLTAAQRFFYSWAECWRQKTRPQQEELLLAVDPHSPPRFRCNGVVSNLDLFYDTFDVQPADGLYLDPAKRVSIW